MVHPAVAADQANQTRDIQLIVPPGVPLRLYLTKRISKKLDAVVEAKVLEPVYAFDRQVIPAGAVVLGKVARIENVPKSERTRAILNGDFTPLHVANIEFTTLVMPDGHKMPLRTEAGPGLGSLVSAHAATARTSSPNQHTGVMGTATQSAKDAIHNQIDRVKSMPDLIRGPGKKEMAEDYLMAKLPYHPQYLRKGTRFDAELVEPLNFGAGAVRPDAMAPFGIQPAAGSVARARLITPLDSASSKPAENVEAVLAEPVYSADHKLILPEGTRLEGTVVRAAKARWFHRSGQLRFTFQDIEVPEEVARLEATAPVPARAAQKTLKVRTQANLQSAESASKTPITVDSEGGVQTKESKTRFLAAAAAVLVASKAGDNDPIRNQSHEVIGQSQNVGGRTLGGGFGFGLLGAAMAQSSRYVGTAFGYYGMAWTLFSTVIARGSEVQFRKNAMIEIRFDTRPDTPAQHFAASDGAR